MLGPELPSCLPPAFGVWRSGTLHAQRWSLAADELRALPLLRFDEALAAIRVELEDPDFDAERRQSLARPRDPREVACCDRVPKEKELLCSVGKALPLDPDELQGVRQHLVLLRRLRQADVGPRFTQNRRMIDRVPVKLDPVDRQARCPVAS